MPDQTAADRLHAAERALSAYAPNHDAAPHDLIGALLDLASQVDKLPAILSRAIHTHLTHTTPIPDDADPEAIIEEAFTQFAGQLTGMLLFDAHHMRYSDPMSILADAHTSYQDRISEDWS